MKIKYPKEGKKVKKKNLIKKDKSEQKFRKTIIYNNDSSDDNSFKKNKKRNLRQKDKSTLSNKNSNKTNNSSNNSSFDGGEISGVVKNNEKLYNIDILNDDLEANERATIDQNKNLNLDNINIIHEKEILPKGKNIKYQRGKGDDNMNIANNNKILNGKKENANENNFNYANSHNPAESINNKIKSIITDLNINEKTTNFTYITKKYYIYTPKAHRQKSNILSWRCNFIDNLKL